MIKLLTMTFSLAALWSPLQASSAIPPPMESIAFNRIIANIEVAHGRLAAGRLREVVRGPVVAGRAWYGFVTRADPGDVSRGVPGKRIPYVCEYRDGKPVGAWYDASADGDLSNDPPAALLDYPTIPGAKSFLIEESWSAALDGKLHRVDRTLRVILEPRRGDRDPPFHLQTVFGMVGTMTIDGTARKAFLHDGNFDGLYTPSFGDGLFIDWNGDGVVEVNPMSPEFGTFTDPFLAGDSKLSVTRVTPNGTLLALIRHGSESPPERAVVGLAAPLFEFVNLDGVRKRLVDYRGRYVMVYFSATWCPTCSYQQERLRALRHDVGTDRLAVVEISYDEDEQALRSARKERWPDWSTSFTGRMEHENEIGRLYGADGAGIMFLVDPSGLLIGRYTLVEELGQALPLRALSSP